MDEAAEAEMVEGKVAEAERAVVVAKEAARRHGRRLLWCTEKRDRSRGLRACAEQRGRRKKRWHRSRLDWARRKSAQR